MRIERESLAQLWVENEDGDRFIPDLSSNTEPEFPPRPGYIYLHSAWPTTLGEEINVTVTAEQVAACDHPADMMAKDTDLVEGFKGRRCRECGGYQQCAEDEPWPEEWRSGHSAHVFSGQMSWKPELVLAMTRPTPEELATQKVRWNPRRPAVRTGLSPEWRGPWFPPMPPLFSLEDAIIISARSCERCMNALHWTYAAPFSETDLGYPEMSEEWKRAGTSCLFCSHMGHVREEAVGEHRASGLA